MSELTREQVESLLPLVSFDARQVLLTGIGFVKSHSALAIMIDNDAALRARLAKVERELDHAKLLVLQLSRDARSPVQDHLLFSTLTAQLAKVEQERDARIAALEEEYERLTGKPYQEKEATL